MDLKKKYEKETGQKPYCWNKSGQYVKSGSYSDGYVKWLEEQLLLHIVVRPNLTEKHPIEGVNETMQVDDDNEEKQLCGKGNCNRPKLEGNVYCDYHYDINFG